MNIFRLFHIFFKIRASGIFSTFGIRYNFLLVPFINKKNPEKNFKEKLEDFGPVYIKLGQLLSTRTDLVSKKLSKELNKLTDDCEAVSFDYIKNTIENELGKKSKNILSNIDKTPLSSASLAQVHVFFMDKKKFVVKVQRPHLKEKILKDINLVKFGIRILRFFIKSYPRIDLMKIINDYERVINNELDFRLEANNAKKTYENFQDSSFLYVPSIVEKYTTKKIIVMEYIDGIPVTNIKELKKYKLNLKALAESGVKIFLKQVFQDNFFHADMHPGNIFAAKTSPKKPFYYAVDYAICGSLSESNQILIAQMISSLLKKDFYSLAQLFIFANWVSEDTKTEELENILRINCEHLLDKPLSQILFGELLLNLLEAMRPFNLYLDNDLLLLIKTLVHIEGMGRQIYPELDFWSVANPFLKTWFKDKYSVKGLVKYLVSKKHILTYMIVKRFEETQEIFDQNYGDIK